MGVKNAKEAFSKDEIIDILKRNVTLYKNEAEFVEYIVNLSLYLIDQAYCLAGVRSGDLEAVLNELDSARESTSKRAISARSIANLEAAPPAPHFSPPTPPTLPRSGVLPSHLTPPPPPGKGPFAFTPASALPSGLDDEPILGASRDHTEEEEEDMSDLPTNKFRLQQYEAVIKNPAEERKNPAEELDEDFDPGTGSIKSFDRLEDKPKLPPPPPPVSPTKLKSGPLNSSKPEMMGSAKQLASPGQLTPDAEGGLIKSDGKAGPKIELDMGQRSRVYKVVRSYSALRQDDTFCPICGTDTKGDNRCPSCGHII